MSEDNQKQSEPGKKPSQELSVEDLKQVAGGAGTTTPDIITHKILDKTTPLDKY